MLTLGSVAPLMAEQLPLPSLNLSGRIPPNDAIIHLDMGPNAAELTLWPEFHNGVAAGLTIIPEGSVITRNWIMYNKPSGPDTAHAGMLLALGLQVATKGVVCPRGVGLKAYP
jgi:anaphase-promoting complex subunit 1